MAVTSSIAVTSYDGQLCLYDGVSTSWTAQGGVGQVVKVDVAVVAESEILSLNGIACDMEHGEVALGTLCLSAVGGKDDVSRLLAEADQTGMVQLQDHAVRATELRVRTTDLGIVRIIEPIDRRGDADVDPAGVGAVGLTLGIKQCIAQVSEGMTGRIGRERRVDLKGLLCRKGKWRQKKREKNGKERFHK